MDLSTMSTKVHRLLENRTDITSGDRDQAINNGLQALAVGKFVDAGRRERLMRFPALERQSDLLLVTSQASYALPASGYTVDLVLHRFQTSPEQWRRLRFKTPSKLFRMQPATGEPSFFTFHQGTLHLRNVPGTDQNGETLRVYDYKLPTALTSSGQSPEIDALWHPLIVLLAAIELASEFGQDETAIALEVRFARELSRRRLPHEMDAGLTPHEAILG